MLTIDTIQHLGQAGPLCARCCRREDGEEDLSAPPMDSGAGAGGGVAGGGGSGGGATLPAGGRTTGDKSGLTDTGSPGGGDDGGQKPAPGGAATVAAAAEQHRNDADTDDQSDSKSDSSRQSGPDPSTERRPRRGTRGGPPPGPPPGYNGRAGGLYSSGQVRPQRKAGFLAPKQWLSPLKRRLSSRCGSNETTRCTAPARRRCRRRSIGAGRTPICLRWATWRSGCGLGSARCRPRRRRRLPPLHCATRGVPHAGGGTREVGLFLSVCLLEEERGRDSSSDCHRARVQKQPYLPLKPEGIRAIL